MEHHASSQSIALYLADRNAAVSSRHAELLVVPNACCYTDTLASRFCLRFNIQVPHYQYTMLYESSRARDLFC